MEVLKKWIFEKILFDDNEDPDALEFDEALADEVDRLGIYEADAKDFFMLDPLTVLKLSAQFCQKNAITINSDTNYSDIIYNALDVLCYEYFYNELKELYKRAQK